MLSFEHTGNFSNTEKFLKQMSAWEITAVLRSLAAEGVSALSRATPLDSGLTAASWSYEITRSRSSWSITWKNSHVVNGAPIAIMLQFGHGTGTGGYVRGRDYINPAIQPVFDRISDEAWKAVTSA